MIQMKIQEMFELHDRVAIITGGATHLGRAMTTALGELGAATVIASRRKALCEQVAAEMREAGIKCVGARLRCYRRSAGGRACGRGGQNARAIRHHGVQRWWCCKRRVISPTLRIDEFTRTWEMKCQEHLYVCTSRKPV